MRRDLGVLCGSFLLLVSLHSFHSYSLDEVYYYGMGVGLADRGRPTVSPCFGEPFLVPAGRPDECWTQYGPGLPSLLAPIVAVAPREPKNLRAASATLLGPMVGSLTILLLSRRLGVRRGLLLFAATPLWFYARTLFSEPLRTLLLLTAFLSPRPAVAGLAAGGAILTRLDSVIFLPFLAWAHADLFRRPRGFVAAALPVAASLALFAAYNHIRYGNPFRAGYVDSGFAGFSGVWAYLLSPGSGLLLFAPIALFGLVPPRAKGERALWTAALLAVLFYGATPNWKLAWDWGPRYLHFTWTALGLLALGRPSLSRAVYLAAGVGIGINLLGIAADYTLHFERLARAGSEAIGGFDPTVAAVADPRFWPPAGQIATLLEGMWDLPLWTRGTWPIGAILAAAGAALLASTAHSQARDGREGAKDLPTGHLGDAVSPIDEA